VTDLQIRFVLDWNYATKENLFREEKYFEKYTHKNPGSTGIQIISSGPDSKRQEIRDNYLRLINKAKKSIYIQTPYFIPDEAVLQALNIAAMSGIDVKLMIPCKPDHPFVYWVTYSYSGDLLESGARIYCYDNGFLHAKGMVVDGIVSCYGTANMDMRSFALNFEVNAVIYDRQLSECLEKAFLKDLECCSELTKYNYERRSLPIRIKEQISRLLAPLM
ncbi:MAG: cardiolipin synthase, partial [Lachnospiraceae bacterium]|nr:cardiolipin synthase [Lachnospiraceae bacterium]